MAEETKTTNRGRKPKVKTEATEAVIPVDTKGSVNVDQSELIKQLMAQIEAQNKAMEELQAKVATQTTPVVVAQNTLSGKKIKCINLMHCVVNISTEPDGQGRVYTFDEYGAYKMIKFDDLSDIVSAYPYTMEHGLIYICDKNAVKELGLEEEYAKLYTKEIMDKIPYLREQADVDMFLGMEKNMQESTALEIAKLIKAGERVDRNFIFDIKEKSGIDIEQLVEELKDEDRRPEE